MNSTVESYEQAVAGHSWWVPDERRGNVVKAFVVLASGYEPGEQLAEAIKAFVRERLSAYAYPGSSSSAIFGAGRAT